MTEVAETTEVQTLFAIPEENFAKFEKAMAKLSRRAQRICGETITPIVFGYEMKEDEQGNKYKAINVLITAENPKIDGWQFVATLDHSLDTGNIIRAVPNTGVAIPEKYRTCAPSCDHCNVNRRRNDTYLLFCEDTSEYKQVGSTCLIDFFGHDVSKAAKLAEYLGYAWEVASGYAGDAAFRFYYDMERFLTICAYYVRLFGFVSRKREREGLGVSTATMADGSYGPNPMPVVCASADDEKLAQDALEWARAINPETPNDYLPNLLVIAHSDVIEPRSTGLAASIIAAYQRELQKKMETKSLAETSQHVGAEKTRQSFGVCRVRKIWTHETDFGTKFNYSFLDAAGNVILWGSSNQIALDVGETVMLTGTVKKHSVFREVKQTEVLRCKIEPIAEAA